MKPLRKTLLVPIGTSTDRKAHDVIRFVPTLSVFLQNIDLTCVQHVPVGS